MIKPTVLSSVLFASFVAADAGSHEAQHDSRLCAVYTAYRNALKSGNKTQLMLVQADCAMYSSPKACRALTATPDKASAAATRAALVYAAYKAALDDCGVPGLMKADADAVDTAAVDLAGRFVGIVTAALTPAIKATKTDAEKAAAKAEKEEATKVAAEQQAAAVDALADAKVAARGDAITLTLADMARIVANAIKTGQLSAEDVAEIDDALVVAETAALLALPVVEVEEVEHVAM